ncbi:MAG: hypothetical protein MAG451_02636 [Anaerolineales bacterium]|nr:hypothetical protein [Anaerolineales bacterium]
MPGGKERSSGLKLPMSLRRALLPGRLACVCRRSGWLLTAGQWRRFAGVLLLAAFGLVSVPLANAQGANAQGTTAPAIEQLEVDLWPEYDDVRLLVIYKGDLVTLPDEPLRFPIPADVEVNAVAYLNEEDRLISLDWDSSVKGDRQVIAFTPPATNFQFEFYADVISSGPDKSFAIEIDVNGQTVNELGLVVQQPAGAPNLQGDPPLSEPVVGFQGLSYYTRRLQNLEPGTVVRQVVTYTKTDDALTVAQVTPSVSEAVEIDPQPTVVSPEPASGTNLAGRSMTRFWLPVGATVIIVLGLAFIGLGAWRAQRADVEPPQPARSRRSRRTRPQATPPSEGLVKFCHQCGTVFESGDRFCGECGARRRGT